MTIENIFMVSILVLELEELFIWNSITLIVAQVAQEARHWAMGWTVRV